MNRMKNGLKKLSCPEGGYALPCLSLLPLLPTAPDGNQQQTRNKGKEPDAQNYPSKGRHHMDTNGFVVPFRGTHNRRYGSSKGDDRRNEIEKLRKANGFHTVEAADAKLTVHAIFDTSANSSDIVGFRL